MHARCRCECLVTGEQKHSILVQMIYRCQRCSKAGNPVLNPLTHGEAVVMEIIPTLMRHGIDLTMMDKVNLLGSC